EILQPIERPYQDVVPQRRELGARGHLEAALAFAGQQIIDHGARLPRPVRQRGFLDRITLALHVRDEAPGRAVGACVQAAARDLFAVLLVPLAAVTADRFDLNHEIAHGQYPAFWWR